MCICFRSYEEKYKTEIFKKGKKMIKYHMNILSYIRKMQEIDILKYLLLDDDQIKLFNFLSKPSVSLIDKKDIYDNLVQKFNVDINREEIDKIYGSFKDLSNKNILSDVDKKLLKFFSDEVENLIL